jgi:BirA family transcriptional regulator, biotin operon repressor / biotin---[acetyl-CoA-carboxylase] ligase
VSAPGAPFLSRFERFGRVDSTQRVVREWLAGGVPEVCLAVADQQTAGRGREGRAWQAPPGAALLLSTGVRPRDLRIGHAWRLGATVALAMLDAAEEQGLREGSLRLKWPNDLVADGPDGPDGAPRKLAGVLGETVPAAGGGSGAGGDLGPWVASAAVGIGINVDWPADRFPAELAATMTSLRVLAGRPVDREALLEGFVARLEPRYRALLDGRFDAAGWSQRQRTTGAWVEVELAGARLAGRATGVDPESGGLLLEVDGVTRVLASGEVTRCRVAARGV